MSAVTVVHLLAKQRKIKTVSFLTILLHLLSLCCGLNWLNDCARGTIFCGNCSEAEWASRELKNSWGIEKKVSDRDCRDSLGKTSGAEVVKWKKTEVKKKELMVDIKVCKWNSSVLKIKWTYPYFETMIMLSRSFNLLEQNYS